MINRYLLYIEALAGLVRATRCYLRARKGHTARRREWFHSMNLAMQNLERAERGVRWKIGGET